MEKKSKKPKSKSKPKGTSSSSSSSSPSSLSPHIEKIRTRVNITEDAPNNVCLARARELNVSLSHALVFSIRCCFDRRAVFEQVNAIEAPDAFGKGFDNSLTLANFTRDLKINIISIDDGCIVFDMIGVDAPIANALRRILLSEIPTMAFERV